MLTVFNKSSFVTWAFVTVSIEKKINNIGNILKQISFANMLFTSIRIFSNHEYYFLSEYPSSFFSKIHL